MSNKTAKQVVSAAVLAIENQISQGNISGLDFNLVVGCNPAISQSSDPEDIWDFGLSYIFPPDGNATITHIVSTDNADNQEIEIDGLLADGTRDIQIKNLNGQTKVALNPPLWRINEGENNDNTRFLGNVSIFEDDTTTNGEVDTLSKVKGYMFTRNQRTLSGIRTIPKGFFGLLRKIKTGFTSNPSGDIDGGVNIREFGKIFIREFPLSFSAASDNSLIPDKFDVPFFVDEKTDILPSIDNVQSNVGIGIYYSLILIAKP